MRCLRRMMQIRAGWSSRFVRQRAESGHGIRRASYRDAFLAALAVGDAKKKDVLDWNPEVRRIVPDRKNRGVYQRQYRVFRQLYERNRDLMAELS